MAQAVPALILGSTALDMKAQNDEMKAKAALNERRAKASTATGQRKASEIRRKGRVLESDAKAIMAAGGGVTDDAGAIEQLADIANVTDYNQLAALYEGDTEAEGLRLENRYNKKITRTKQLATALSGSSKAFGAA
jgi:hypothetical protein